MGKLWHKNYELDAFVEKFTVGQDYKLDQRLLKADCVASLAHATMLAGIGLLTQEELASLKEGLVSIIKAHDSTGFPITQADEDGHTAIENALTARYGDAGKKIHTGRSRNDQVIVATRLYARAFLLTFLKNILQLVNTLLVFAEENKLVPMAGRTHMQIAMPSSVGLWAGAYAEQLLDDCQLVKTAYQLNNQSPLGSAASYGVPLPLNRELVAELLGFAKVQNNVLYANNSRGKMESIILDAVDQVVLTLSKMAQDLILYSMPEFAYFTLPDNLCSGSSIMPQKKNPCGLELLRAKSATVSACAFQIKNIIKALPSGYNRDFQETKEPFLRGGETGLGCVQIMNLAISKVQVNKEALRAGFRPEIYATDAALELVAKGMPFRDAYKEVGLHLDQLESRDPETAIKARTYTGTTGNLRLDKAQAALAELESFAETEEEKIDGKITKLVGFPVQLFVEDN
ncbi:MAG: argininosuccinate lyase [Firmicutes bacterium]|nr:argininosuccinate lyase [Bacillota bacterium]